MTDSALAIRNAQYVWEIGLLRFLYRAGILTEQEYKGIGRIAKQQTGVKIVVSYLLIFAVFAG